MLSTTILRQHKDTRTSGAKPNGGAQRAIAARARQRFNAPLPCPASFPAPMANPVKKQTARRRIPVSILSLSCLRSASILPSSWLAKHLQNRQKTANYKTGERNVGPALKHELQWPFHNSSRHALHKIKFVGQCHVTLGEFRCLY
jgi:hypothetical protein